MDAQRLLTFRDGSWPDLRAVVAGRLRPCMWGGGCTIISRIGEALRLGDRVGALRVAKAAPLTYLNVHFAVT